MTTATVLLSGGLDSTTLVAQLLDTGHQVHGLGVWYGQRHGNELDHAAKVAAYYGIRFDRLELSDLQHALRGSALTGGTILPEGHYSDASMAATVVPNRNAILLSVAAGHAATRGYDYVATAVHTGDHPIYPDCRPEFIAAISHTTELACGVPVQAPFVAWSKAEIAALAVALEVPVALTWSCYDALVHHCGRCGTCVERAEALNAATAGHDPTIYVDPDFWRTAVAQ